MSDTPFEAAPAEPVAAETPAEPQAPAQDAVPAADVVAQQPSSANETQQPESSPEAAVEQPLSLQDAVKALLIFVKAHRTIGDADLAASVADVEAALSAQDEQA